ncbi:MAG: hsK1 [Clostridia bacterium]|nr:hsK1 [Clostridia bacterium]
MNINSTLFPLEASVLASSDILDKLTSLYTQKIRTCRFYYRGIHDTYIVKAGCEIYYFKIYRYGFRSKEEIQIEIDWLKHLKECGIYATMPIVNMDGEYITEFNTLQGIRYGVLFSSVGTLSFNEVEETDLINKKLGEYLASMHCALDSMEYTSCRSELNIDTFINIPMQHIKDFAKFYTFDLDFLETVAISVKEKISVLSNEAAQYGICHGDFYSGNIRFNDSNIPVSYDFDFSGYGWRAYDISLYASPFSWGADTVKMQSREKRKTAFLNGYSKIRSISDDEIKSIDLFTPFRRIFNIGIIYICMSNTWGDDWAIKNLNSDITMLRRWLELNPVL